MFKYRLKDCPENKGLESRCIQSITLKKNEWTVFSTEQTKLENFKNLIDVVEFDPLTEMKEEKEKQAQIKTEKDIQKEKEEKEEYLKQLENSKKNITDNTVVNDFLQLDKRGLIEKIISYDNSFEKKFLNKKSKEELYQMLLIVSKENPLIKK